VWWASHSAQERISASIPRYVRLYTSVADPGSVAFLTPGSRIGDGKKSRSGIRKKKHLRIIFTRAQFQYFGCKIQFFVAIRIRDPVPF
jgi:hypothetical protein